MKRFAATWLQHYKTFVGPSCLWNQKKKKQINYKEYYKRKCQEESERFWLTYIVWNELFGIIVPDQKSNQLIGLKKISLGRTLLKELHKKWKVFWINYYLHIIGWIVPLISEIKLAHVHYHKIVDSIENLRDIVNLIY